MHMFCGYLAAFSTVERLSSFVVSAVSNILSLFLLSRFPATI